MRRSVFAATINEVPTMASKGNRHALQHGLYSRETVLPWESEQTFNDLHRSFVDELNPDGPLEEEAVRESAELHLRKQRLAMGYLLPFYRQLPSPELTEAARQGLIALATYLGSASSTMPGPITATSSQILDFIKGKIGGDSAAQQRNHTAPAYTAPTSSSNIVEQAYDPAGLALRLKIETAIDNRIAKVMTR